VNVGRYALNIICRGTGSPTIVFENGQGPTNLGTWFQTNIANAFPTVRTCAYDRVNTGTSDRDTARHTGQDSVRDLHKLLDLVTVRPPYLIVGHSLGGLLAAMYAGTYPTDVVGLVLLDPSLPAHAQVFDLLPERERAAARAADETNSENLDWSETLEQSKVLLPKIPNVPVFVLAATDHEDFPPGRREVIERAFSDFVAALPRGELRHVDSGHMVQSEQPGVVISEIRRMLDVVS
jgi:pimeloyl-ACP methyl ester carboxylesterase